MEIEYPLARAYTLFGSCNQHNAVEFAFIS